MKSNWFHAHHHIKGRLRLWVSPWVIADKGEIMLFKTRPVFIDGYGFDDTPLEVGPVGWCLLTIARIWMAFAFLFAIAVGIVMIALCSPLSLPILGCDILVDKLLSLRQKGDISNP